MNPDHPLLMPNGYRIYTKPIERAINMILFNIDADHHGIDIEGRGRDGKTQCAQFLAHDREWLNGRGAITRVIVPKGSGKTDATFYGKLCRGIGLSYSERTSGEERRERFINLLLERCGAAGARLMVLFLDEAQRITREELDYLVDLDNVMENQNVRLFIVFIRQSDVSGPNIRTAQADFPSHIVGRFFMGTHRFTGLLDAADVHHALGRYDDMTEWPEGSGISFTHASATRAFEKDGYRLAHQTELIMSVVRDVRREAGLKIEADWPMKTFCGSVKYLLCDVAATNPDFVAFTEEHILKALRASGYLTLEYVRANLILDSEVA